MPPSARGFTVVMDLSSILDVTDEHDHLARLLDSRITRAGGVRESELEAFIFAVLEDREGRLRDRLTASLTATGLKETVSRVIDEMMDEGEESVATSFDGGKTQSPSRRARRPMFCTLRIGMMKTHPGDPSGVRVHTPPFEFPTPTVLAAAFERPVPSPCHPALSHTGSRPLPGRHHYAVRESVTASHQAMHARKTSTLS
ncbi:hypothetical protein RJ40_00850 [Methanofollis aquaemaris]|uniref:Uncharacterized protein n=1 Tax=Methanofollis aquaemaris TaxID=126734 RepID=A0A8A3S173_9EURY|nr:hypothetical protein [Methanofollis aquaemaris]QSZ66148.1 hypothetical protein RJ40_00850 [Methanofollis aquaemaris]